MTTHMASCRDLAKNETDLKQLRELFLTLMTTSTPTALLFPWFPSPGRVKTTMANVKMFFILRRYIEARRDEVPTSDAIDVLISDGETTQDIVQVGFCRKGWDLKPDSTFPVCRYVPFLGYR